MACLPKLVDFRSWLSHLGCPEAELTQPESWLDGPACLPPEDDWTGRHLAFLTHLFEGAGDLLRVCGPEISAAILLGLFDHDLISVLFSTLPASARWRAIASQLILFRDCFTACPQEAHDDNWPCDPQMVMLCYVCAMWWDLCPWPESASDAAQVVDVQRRVLGIDHYLCQKAAIYGLDFSAGLWPDLGAAEVLREYAATHPALPPRLADYLQAFSPDD